MTNVRCPVENCKWHSVPDKLGNNPQLCTLPDIDLTFCSGDDCDGLDCRTYLRKVDDVVQFQSSEEQKEPQP